MPKKTKKENDINVIASRIVKVATGDASNKNKTLKRDTTRKDKGR